MTILLSDAKGEVQADYIAELERIINAIVSPAQAVAHRTPVTRLRAMMLADRAFCAYQERMSALGESVKRDESLAATHDLTARDRRAMLGRTKEGQ